MIGPPDIDERGANPGIGSSVIIGEVRLGQGTAVTANRWSTRPARHAASVRDHNRPVTSPSHARPRWIVLTTLALAALNLRIALSSVPVVIDDIQAATGWSDAVVGTLTTIPVLCMGAFALVVPRVAHVIGRQRTVALALVLLAVALAARAFADRIPPVLFASAFLAGVGIALAAGLVPSVVREQLPDSVGRATGLWTAAMMTGAALGGALTVPLFHWLDSWPLALAAWSIPAAVALVVWWVVEGRAPEVARDPSARARVRIQELPWRDRRAWSLTGYLTLNSVIFYTALAWLAPSYVDRGATQAGAGWYFGLFTASQVIAALVLPAVAERVASRQALYAIMVVVGAFSLVVIGWAPDLVPIIVVAVFGAALGSSFAMGLALLSEFAADGAGSARLTAMAFSVTYLVAALGPALAGVAMDHFDSWPLVYSILAAVLLLQLLTVPALRRGVRIG